MRKGKFFKLVGMRWVSEVRKKWKTNAWSLDFDEKGLRINFQKKSVCARGGEKFLVPTKIYTQNYSSLLESNLKKSFSSTKKIEKTNVWSLDLCRKIKDSCSQKMHARAEGGKFFSGYYQKMLKGKFFILVTIHHETKFLKSAKLEKHHYNWSKFATSSAGWLT